MVITPNHCRPCDPMVIGLLGAEAGSPVYMMASWHLFMGSRFQAWLLRRMGAFSVYREGMDRTAVKAAIEMLVEAHRPLVVFPEGIVSRGNDRLARAQRRAGLHRPLRREAPGEERSGSTDRHRPRRAAVPFSGRLEETVAPVLDRIEARLTWQPRTELPLIERLRLAGNAILGLKELELVGEFREGGIQERLARLIDDILVPLEVEWKVKKRDATSLAGACPAGGDPPGARGGQLADAERDRRWVQLARLYLAQQLSLYPAGYLAGNTEPRACPRDGRATRGRLDRRGHRPPAARGHHPGRRAHRGDAGATIRRRT